MRVDLPAGTVTFLFTDVEGSTNLLAELRERRQIVEKYDVIVVGGVAELAIGGESTWNIEPMSITRPGVLVDLYPGEANGAAAARFGSLERELPAL